MKRSTAIVGIVIVYVWCCYCAPGLSLGAGNAEYGVLAIRDVMVEMRDGVKLATDLYLPAKNGRAVAQKLPAVLMRTPYNKARWGVSYTKFFGNHSQYFE